MTRLRRFLLAMVALIVGYIYPGSTLAAQSPPSIALVKTTTTALTIRVSIPPVNYGILPPFVVAWTGGPTDTVPAGQVRDTVVLPRNPRPASTTVRVCVSPLIAGSVPVCASKTYSNPVPPAPPAPPPAPPPPAPVPPPPITITSIAIAPKVDTVPIGSSRQFSATATWSDGTTKPLTPQWGGGGGSITIGGTYTAGTVAGTYLVTAGAQTKADTARITLLVPTPPPPSGGAVIQDLGIIPSPLLGNGRRVRVYLPPGYATSTQRYPVLYMQDGAYIFGSNPPRSPGAKLNLDSTTTVLVLAGAVRPVMVVAIDGQTSQTGRGAEYGWNQRGQLYARMVIEELKPRIDAAYRTLPGPATTGIGGSSLGGILAWHMALTYSNVFGILLAQSAVIRGTDTTNVNHIATVQNFPGKPPLRIWFDRGTNDGEVRHQVNEQEMRAALLAKGMVEEQDFAYRLAVGATHDWSFWAKRVDPFMRFLFPAVGPVPPAPPPPGPSPAPAPPPSPVPPPAPAPPPGTYPNEPAGVSLLSERSFNAKVESGWLDRGDAAFSLVADSSAPRSPVNVGQALFSPRINCGVGPIATYYIVPASTVRTLYLGFWLKMDPAWYGSHSGINKLIFIQIAGGNRVFAAVGGARTGSLSTMVNFQWMGTVDLSPTAPLQRQISWNGGANLNQASAAIARGQWVKWEIILVANTPGQFDGEAHWWLDGVKVGQYTAIGYSGLTETGAKNVWQGVMWNPTYGGGCNVPTLPADTTLRPPRQANAVPASDQFPVPQWMRLDHVRVSGKP